MTLRLGLQKHNSRLEQPLIGHEQLKQGHTFDIVERQFTLSMRLLREQTR